MDLNRGLLPTPFIPPLSITYSSINQTLSVSFQPTKNPSNPPIEPMKESMVDPPSS